MEGMDFSQMMGGMGGMGMDGSPGVLRSSGRLQFHNKFIQYVNLDAKNMRFKQYD